MLDQYPVIGFIPTKDAALARAFYVETLGLSFVSEDNFALVVKAHGTMVRITIVGEFTPHPFTIFGWEITQIETVVEQLTARGIDFLRFPFLEQSEEGIWAAPGGAKVAWFRDLDGNTLSISQH